MSTLAQTTTSPSSTLAVANTALIGPLTSVFTTPSSCITNEAITTGNENNTFFLTQSLFNNGPSGAPMIRTECFPPKYPHDQFRYYSPGVCPSGWVLNSSPSVQSRFASSTDSGETIGICCPPRYTYQDGPIGCTSYMAQATSGSLLSPSYFIYFGHGVNINGISLSTITTGAVMTSSYAGPHVEVITTAAVSVSGSSYSYSEAIGSIITSTVSETLTILTSIAPQNTTVVEIVTVINYITSSVGFGGGFGAISIYSTIQTTTGNFIYTIPGSTQTLTSVAAITFSQISASTIYTTSNIAAGTVYASGIQVRWTGEYPLPKSHPLSPGVKAGIAIGVLAFVFLVCVLAWLFLRYRARKRHTRQLYVSHEPTSEDPYPETGKGELPATSPINEYSSSPQMPIGAEPEGRENGHTENETHTRVSSGQVYVTSTLNSSLAELGSLRSVSALKRKPVSTTVELESAPALPSNISPAVPSPADSTKPLPTPLEEPQFSPKQEQPEQASLIAMSSSTMREDSASSRRERFSDAGEEERLRRELEQVVERKERVRELQRLKEEEERLARIEEELRMQIRGS